MLNRVRKFVKQEIQRQDSVVKQAKKSFNATSSSVQQSIDIILKGGSGSSDVQTNKQLYICQEYACMAMFKAVMVVDECKEKNVYSIPLWYFIYFVNCLIEKAISNKKLTKLSPTETTHCALIITALKEILSVKNNNYEIYKMINAIYVNCQDNNNTPQR